MAPGPIKRVEAAWQSSAPCFQTARSGREEPTGVSTLSSLHRFDFSPILLCLLGYKPKPHGVGSAPDVLHVPTVHL